MELITKKLEERFKKIGTQENKKDPIVVAKYFNPTGIGTWYATAYYPEEKIFFGYVSRFKDEWGSFSLEELESFRGPFCVGIERDLYYKEQKISKFEIPSLTK